MKSKKIIAESGICNSRFEDLLKVSTYLSSEADHYSQSDKIAMSRKCYHEK